MPGSRLLGAPDPAILDVPELVRAVLARPKPSVLIAPCPPFSNVIAGMIAAERMGIPWIADMQDPFSRTPMFRPSTVLHRRAMEKLEERVLVRAGVVLRPGDRRGLLKALEDLRAGRVPVAPVEERRARLHANRGDVQATELASSLEGVVRGSSSLLT